MEKIHELMDAEIYRAPTAKAAIDIACYDVVGKALNVPVYHLIGGRYHDEFPITHVLSIHDPEEMAEQASQKLAGGYRSLKMRGQVTGEEGVISVQAGRTAIAEE